MSPSRAGFLAALGLGLAYFGTLAPSVTFWDAGEFIGAAHALGIPHPPGTPLYVMLLSLWSRAASRLPFALASNSFSALSTAIAMGGVATMIATGLSRRNGPNQNNPDHAPIFGLAAALCAGSMFSVWSNATETEVYGTALLLAIIMLVCAERAGRLDSARWRVVTAYTFGLAIPLHISSLVAAPAAAYLASTTPARDTVDVRTAAAMLTAAIVAMAIGAVSYLFLTIAAVVGAIAVLKSAHEWRIRVPLIWRSIAAVIGGATMIAFLLVRARHDPFINQGDPASWRALVDVVGRRQYDVAPLWPRRAPLWLQMGNWFEYADWQTALSLGPGVVPTVARTCVSVSFAFLALVGASRHRAMNRRGWRAVLILTICGSLGVVAYLNLRLSPSFGWGVVPDTALREARERDYFFVLGFVGWGIWAGIGAVSLAQRLFRAPLLGLAIAALPIALNWTATNRRRQPEASEPRTLARALLEGAPPNAVLFVAGDNDTYPLWYVQEVEGDRRDVTVVTLPLLPADWYKKELRDRLRLAEYDAPRGPLDPAAWLAAGASRAGHAIAAAITVTPRDRSRIGGCWRIAGLDLIESSPAQPGGCSSSAPGAHYARPKIDLPVTRHWADRIAASIGYARPGSAIDPVDEYFFDVLSCPAHFADLPAFRPRYASLDSLCNP